MAAGHILRMTRGRPLVQLKIAVSADGLIAPGEGAPVWVTGPEARQYAHLLRARADAMMVGRRTVEDDDPELTCRLPGLANRSPRRVVLDPKFRISPALKMFQTAHRVPVIIFGAEGNAAPAYPGGVEARQVRGRRRRAPAPRGGAAVALQGWGDARAGRGRADDRQRACRCRSRRRGGHRPRHRAARRAGRKPFGDSGLEMLDDAGRWRLGDKRMIGADTLTLHRRFDRFAEGTQA